MNDEATGIETGEAIRLTESSVGTLVYLTSFVGREHEIAWVRERLIEGHRIITITGPGGVGKSRLALAVSSLSDIRSTFIDGVFFIPLAQVGDAAMVIPVVARSLGVHADVFSSAVERLAAAIGEQRLLLILDSLEQVIGASLDLRRLVDSCPNLALLVTSRRAMRITGEQEFSLASLPLPELGKPLIEEMNDSPAVRLFVDRAVAANPAFALTPETAPSVIEICYRLDGLPLAIELAAARTKMLSVQALASRLTGRLQILTSGPRDAPLRQQTLRETVRWSYDLLTPFEQLVFRRMSVLAGGATLEAIGAIAGRGIPVDEMEVLDVVASLVDQSLLVRDEAPGQEVRFRMLETIREFALEALSGEEDVNSIRDAHAAYFLKMAEQASSNEYGADEAGSILALEPDLGNIRLALGWLLIDREFDSHHVHLGLRLTGALTRVWELRGYITEEREWLIHALSTVPSDPTAERAKALTGLGVNYWFSNQLSEAEVWQRQALDVWRQLDHTANVVRSIWFLALVAGKRGDVARLEELLAEAEALHARIPGILWHIVPDAIRALIELARGDCHAADQVLVNVQRYHHEHNYPWPEAWTIGLRADAALMRGSRAEAMDLMRSSLSLFAETGDVYAMLDGMLAMAQHRAALGDPENAARILGVVERVRKSVGVRLTWRTATEDDVRSAVVAALGKDRADAIVHEASSMSLKEGVALALAAGGSDLRATRTSQPAGGFNLSARELEILQLLAQGKTNQEIGDELFISHRTAGTHVANILGKLGVHSRAAAVAVALNNRLV